LPNIPGFLATIKVLPESSIAPIFLSLYRYAWFVGFGLAFFIYLALRKATGPPEAQPNAVSARAASPACPQPQELSS
jgi:cytosine/uracil/thiamine/allantoin permease